jgi:transcriptional regulator with GAF, ATPase, and Fis domain
MYTHDRLAQRLPALRDAAGTFLSLEGLGAASLDGPDTLLVTWSNDDGITTIGTPVTTAPAALLPRASGVTRLSESESGASTLPSLHRLLFPDRTIVGDGTPMPREVIAVPLQRTEAITLLLAGADTRTLQAEQLARLESLAAEAGHWLARSETAEEEAAWLHRITGFEELLHVLVQADDLQELVGHIASVTRSILPRDYMALTLFDEHEQQARVYSAHASAGNGSPQPAIALQTTSIPAIEDVRHAVRHDTGGALRAMLRVPLRIHDRIAGVLDFAAEPVGRFTTADARVAERIADYVALALAHRQLVDEARAAAVLRAREEGLVLLDNILSTVSEVLDVREVFDRVFELSQKAMAHDAMAIAVASRDNTHIKIYATTGAVRHLPIGLEIKMPDPTLVQRQWEFELIPDMLEDPRYAQTNSARAGMRCLIMIPVRIEQQVRGWVNFFSRTPHRFSAEDVSVARRIAAHVVLTLSHQRLAEQARLNEELRARTTNLELLDALLNTMGEAVGVSDLFARIAGIAAKVLPHDLAVLMVRLPDGVHARVYAKSGPGLESLPIGEVTEVPEELLRNPDWEYDIFDDLALLEAPRYRRLVDMGFQSLLRVPVRLEGRFAGALVFLSRSKAGFQQAHVLIARRMADRLAVTLAHDRELEASKRADEATARAARLEARVRALTEELDARTGYRRVIGESREWRQVLTQAAQVAATDTTVLLLGESGTGKEVIARFLHRGSSRKNGPFVALNCAALPEQLLEAELFGYERGAFTGAMTSKPGQLEQAAGGTLFLDEVGEMSPSAQAKFLRVLQEREFQRLGGTRVLRTDARVVAATNRDLQRAIANGQFREDLYYRLDVFAIRLPPLRDRRDDVLPLAEAFLAEIGRGLGTPPGGISREARQSLMEYHWPGNVRELRNILERAAILCDGGLITAEHLALTVVLPPPLPRPAATAAAPAVDPTAAGSQSVPPAAGDLQSMERTMIEQALKSARFNKSKAAKALGLTRHQLYIRMRKYGFE